MAFWSRTAAVVLLTCGLPSPAYSQQHVIPLLHGPIELDGHVTETAWIRVQPLPMTMFEPEFQAPIFRTSTVRLAHDGHYLYVAGVFVDDATPTTNSLIRDYYAEDDLFNVIIDSFNDDETAFYFLVTPAGTRIDGVITDDVEGSNWQQEAFDNVWDAAAVLTADGWSAEMRIPLTSLRFRSSEGVVRMGLIVGRLIVRNRERHTFPAIRPGPSMAQFKPSLAADIVLEGVYTPRPLELRPYGLGGWTGSSQPASGETGHSYDLGGDAKIAISPRITLDLTINTDFAQTEADALQVNLDRFSLFFPEKRQFFLERAGIFMFGYADEHQLFYSRRVGLSELGVPERIYGGVRSTARVGRGDLGALALQVDRQEGGWANLSAVRYRRPFLSRNSYIGVMATGVAKPGAEPSAFAGGLDTQIDLSRTHFATASIAMSHDSTGKLEMHTRLSGEKRNRAGWAYRVAAAQIGASYNPPLGFVRRRGIQQIDVAVSRGSFGRTGRIQESLLTGSTHVVRRRTDEAIETASVGISWDGRRRGGGTGAFKVAGRHENVLDDFRLDDGAFIPAGEYDFLELTTSIGLPDGWSRRAYIDLSGGQYFDGRRLTIAVRPVWNVSRHLELGADLEMNRLAFPKRDQSFDADILRLRFRAAANTRLSASGLIQHDGVSGQIAANVRLRYHVSEGRDAYFVWNETRGLPILLDPPTESGDFNRRSLVIKYTHAVRW